MGRSAYLFLSLVPFVAATLASGGKETEPKDPIARLQDELASGEKPLGFEPRHGYLRSLLQRLGIDPSSQTLVFSKTSLQSDFIAPKTPRAIYFNADTYVGWIPGAPLIEIMSVHPTRGVVFYTLRNDKPGAKAFQTEKETCFRCHGGIAPSLFANSSPIAPSGYPRVFERTYNATPDLPLRLRWGGWYVTGSHGLQRHMGNELSLGNDEKHRIDIEKGANVTDLRRYLDVRPYLTPHSDIVALMVMEAQMEVQNVLTRTHAALRDGDSAAEACEPLVEALLGCGETKLASPIKGTSDFATRFAQTAPKDPLGRSLSQLDLRTRLLKHTCSPLIYSESFEALPPAAKAQVWRRLRDVLLGKDRDARFGHLSAADRRATFEILRDTEPDFARAAASQGS